jgi:hypothetical protein
MIKSPSAELFSFNQLRIVIPSQMTSPIIIHQDATFIFANTSNLRLVTYTNNLQEVASVLKVFGNSQLDTFTMEIKSNDDRLRLDSAVQSQVNALHFTYNSSGVLNLEKLLKNEYENGAAWAQLTELTVNNSFECKIHILTPLLFELCPQLRKLELNLTGVCKLADNVFKNANNLIELKLSAFKELKLTPDCFHGLVNIQVLELTSFHEVFSEQVFEMISSLSCLESLDISSIMLSTKTLDKFPPDLLKLRKLKLGLAHVQCISPTAF